MKVRNAFEDEPEYELPLSMVDVVFLLLVFFMCASTFRSSEDAIHHQNKEGDIGPRINPHSYVTIRIEGNGGMVLEATRLSSPEDLRRRLTLLRQVDPEKRVVLAAEARVPFRYVVAAYDSALMAGMAHVRFRKPVRSGSPAVVNSRM